jgi:release factor glutamine methyltransferase
MTAPRENAGGEDRLEVSDDLCVRVSASLRELANLGAEFLEKSGVPNARNNAEWILCDAAGCSRLQIYLDDTGGIPPGAARRYVSNLRRRADREPLQYILGSTEFMSLPFHVPPSVFVPRPDTETLVEEAEVRLRSMPLSPCLQVLDLCCGSGVIAVSLARRVPNLEVWAVDASAAAVAATRINAEVNGVQDRTHVVHSSAERFLHAGAGGNRRPAPLAAEGRPRYDAVVCNPPYIVTGDIPTLPPEVRKHEPIEALDGGPDGLDFYRRIVPVLPRRLEPGGLAAFEIGDTQERAVAAMMETAGFAGVSVKGDLAGRPRVVTGVLPA